MMIEQQNAEQAAYWFSEMLKQLEASVRQAGEVRHQLTEGVRESLATSADDPLLLATALQERVRALSSAVRVATSHQLRRRGVQMVALERQYLILLSEDAGRASDVLVGVLAALRQRIEVLGNRGTEEYERGHASVSESASEVQEAILEARARWERGPGRGAQSLLPWRRLRARRKDPLHDTHFKLDLVAAVQRVQPGLQRAFADVARGALELSVAHYYNDLANQISEWLASARRLSALARGALTMSRRSLNGLRRKAQSVDEASKVLLDNAVLDAVLDELEIHALAFQRRGHISHEELSTLSETELLNAVRDWVESELSPLPSPTLGEVLGGFSGEEAVLAKRLSGILTRGQPLIRFDDDLVSRFPEGARALSFAVAQGADDVLLKALGEACRAVSFPTPLAEPGEREDDQELRVMLLVAGLPFFSQLRRLTPLLRTHEEVRGQVPNNDDERAMLRGLLDMGPEVRLSSLIPSALDDAWRRSPDVEDGEEMDAEEAPLKDDEGEGKVVGLH